LKNDAIVIDNFLPKSLFVQQWMCVAFPQKNTQTPEILKLQKKKKKKKTKTNVLNEVLSSLQQQRQERK
jgi:hypothetical protein